MSKEAMKLALEALTHLQPTALTSFYTIGDRDKAITALREALAAQQEPVAYRVKWPAIGGGHKWLMVDKPLMEKEGFVNEALYTSPPAQRKPLSVDEIFEAIRPLYSSDKAAWLAVNHSKDEYRAIEAAHGITKGNT